MKLVYNVDKCEKNVSALLSLHNDLVDCNQRLCSELSVLSEGWQGESANAFMKKAVKDVQDLVQTINLLQERMQTLLEVHELHKEAKELAVSKLKEALKNEN